MQELKTLAEARNSTEAINIAYQALNAGKAGKDVLTVQALCTKAGIPSRGYFSLVMNGKRVLSRKYGETLARVLKLKGIERDLFLALLDADHETKSLRRRQLRAAIVTYRKLLMIDESAVLPASLASEALTGDVFCAFSLFPAGAEQDQILGLFPKHRHGIVRAVLKDLCKEGYLQRNNHTYRLARQGSLFLTSKERSAPARYISNSFSEVAELVPTLVNHLDRCYVTSLSVSLKRSDYPQFLQNIKKSVKELVVGVNDDSGDQIIRVNVGVHPSVPAIDAFWHAHSSSPRT